MKFIEDEKREIIILSRNREEEDRARHSFVRARVQDLPQTPRGGEGRGNRFRTTSELDITAQSRGGPSPERTRNKKKCRVARNELHIRNDERHTINTQQSQCATPPTHRLHPRNARTATPRVVHGRATPRNASSLAGLPRVDRSGRHRCQRQLQHLFRTRCSGIVTNPRKNDPRRDASFLRTSNSRVAWTTRRSRQALTPTLGARCRVG